MGKKVLIDSFLDPPMYPPLESTNTVHPTPSSDWKQNVILQAYFVYVTCVCVCSSYELMWEPGL